MGYKIIAGTDNGYIVRRNNLNNWEKVFTSPYTTTHSDSDDYATAYRACTNNRGHMWGLADSESAPVYTDDFGTSWTTYETPGNTHSGAVSEGLDNQYVMDVDGNLYTFTYDVDNPIIDINGNKRYQLATSTDNGRNWHGLGVMHDTVTPYTFDVRHRPW